MMAGTTLSAEQVGHRDPPHFTLAFRKRYGTSPQKFRVQRAARRKAEWE